MSRNPAFPRAINTVSWEHNGNRVTAREMKTLSFLILVAIGLSGCQTPPPRQTVLPPKMVETQPVPGAQPAPEKLQRALLDTDYDFARASEEKGAPEAFFDFLTADATLLPEGEPAIKGRDAIKVYLSARPQGLLTWKPREAGIGVGSDVGYTTGAYEFRENSTDGRPQIRYGKYVTIWNKQPDGSWKAGLTISNSSPPPGERR
jgi:ketosteroid isomerase-like protein